MGGVATVKAMNKVVGIGVVKVSSVGGVLRRPSSPIYTTLKADPVKPAIVESSDVQKTASGFDDWEFTDVDVEDVAVAPLPHDDGQVVSPRTVFGGVPSLDEAREAISELFGGLSSPVSPRFGSGISSPVSPRFGSGISSPVSPRFGSGISSPVSPRFGSSFSSPVSPRFASGLSSPVSPRFGLACLGNPESTHAVQAFNFLNGSREIQEVVESIATDPDVWEAVFKIPQVQQFLRSKNIRLSADHMNPCSQSSDTDDDADDGEYNLENEIMYIWKSAKDAVAEMMSNLSVFLSNLFGGVLSTGKYSSSAAAKINFFEKALGPSLMGLVIMVIMAVFMKRAS